MQDTQTKTKYVLIISKAIDVIREALTRYYGKHWELKIEGNSKGQWSIKWQENDQHDQKLAEESFSITYAE